MTTAAEVAEFRAYGSWRELAEKALRYIDIATPHYPGEISWALGGGTRLMLEFEHRISHDIDIFIPDPSVQGLLSPRLNDAIAAEVATYNDEHGALKFHFQGLGEIDFIFCPPVVGGDLVTYGGDFRLQLEPVVEVFAKKLYHRGSRITPRDLFDWWFVGTHAPDQLETARLAKALTGKLDGIEQALDDAIAMRTDPAPIFSPMAAWPRIRSPALPRFEEAVEWAKDHVSRMRSEL